MENNILISDTLKLWEKDKEILRSLFSSRDKENAKEQMEASITRFLHILYSFNNESIPNMENWQKSISGLKNKPINVEERLTFIVKKPDQYQSYIQLAQLFEEFTKQYFKQISIQKAVPHKK